MADEIERREIAGRLIDAAFNGRMRGTSEHAMLCRCLGCEGWSWRRMFLRLAELIGPEKTEG